jgi:NADPH:quinone reductase-like Zn-dependent oxidoreductase
MKALIFRQHGDRDQLEYTDVAEPVVGPEEVLIRVHAVALNHLDIWVRRGLPELQLTLPHIGGSDIAGEVVAVGDTVTDLWIGSRVVVNPALIADHGNPFPDISIIGEHTPGGFAEYVVVPVENMMPIPPSYSYVQAAAAPVVYQTAWRALITRAQVRPGERVLIHGAGAGTGGAAIQIAKLAGAYVYATTSTADKMERALEIGADEVINYHEQDVTKAIWQSTNKRGVDVVIDHIGADTWEQSMRMLKRGGRLVTFGATSGAMAQTNINLLFWRQLTLIGTTAATHAEFRQVMELVIDGTLTPIVDRVMPLSDGSEAQRILEQGEQFGKIVLEP